MSVVRKIVGPQEQFERNGAQSLRDIRPFTTRLSEGLRSSASGLVLAVTAGITWFEPAVIDATVPLSVFYAIWVLTRAPKLPIRLPKSAARPDYSNPQPGSRKPKPSNGTIFIGWSIEGYELWATAEDMRQHMTIPGTTGAGKTTAILSLLSNALMQGSGFVLVDGKGDRDVIGKVLALARRFGREDDLRVLNFMVASGAKDSHTFNPFAIGNADAIRELVVSQLVEPDSNGNAVFQDRAVALIGTIAPVLVWLRDTKAIPLNIDVIRFSIELRWIWRIAMQKLCMVRDTETGATRNIDVSDIPEDIIWPLKAYLGELPGFDPDMPLDKQKGDEPSKQHGFAQMYFTKTFQQLGSSLGHIFRVETGDIEMRDIVLNRRILVVNLPALENSDATLAALGKLVVSSLRAMMAQLLGGSLEGDYTEEDKPGMGPSPYFVVFDEVAYYATSGLDRMLAMGRGLNCSFMLGFQEVSGIWARLGEKTASLLGNANFTIAMRQQDSGRTREWIEKTAGQTFVTQATSYQGAGDGNYREARHAEVRPVSRIDWNDLTSLIEGEAIVLFGGRRVYARVFHAQIDDSGPKRIGRTLMLRAPDVEDVKARMKRIAQAAAVVESGALAMAGGEKPSSVIEALRDGFIAAGTAKASGLDCARAALAAVAGLPKSRLPPRPPPPADGMPITAVTPMLRATSEAPVLGGGKTGGAETAEFALCRSLAAVDRLAGVDQVQARETAIMAIMQRDDALKASAPVEPPAMTSEAFCVHLDALLAGLSGLQASNQRQAA